MKKYFRLNLRMKGLSLLIATLMLVSIFANIQSSFATEQAVTITKSSGWLESAYVEWEAYNGADFYNVYIKKTDGDYQKLDDALVRTYPGYFRADALGLVAGEYIFKIVPTLNNIEISESSTETSVLTVLPHNREGFAFTKTSTMGTASGAYNDDGSLRDGADILYLTNGNKDTVMLNNDPTLGVGLVEILSYRESKKIKKTLNIRVIGCVTDPEKIDNTTHTVRFVNTDNVTLEGVGDDAVIHGWIMTLKRTQNFEIRNLGFMYGGEGADAASIVHDTDNKNMWVHNCDFFYGAPGKDADQVKGDGSINFKSKSDFISISYNHYWDIGKTCVSGGPWEVSNADDERAQYGATYHHNWFDHSDSRHPRCVAGSNHIYNNFYDGNAMYGIGAAVKTSVFSENNYYRNCPRPMIIASQGSDCWDEATQTYKSKGTLSGQIGGMIKSYGDVIIGAKRFYDQNNAPHPGQFDAYIASSRGEIVPDTIKAYSGGATYNNFDTNPEIMYEYDIDTPEEAVEKVKKYAGRVDGGDFKWEFDNSVDDPDHSVIQGLLDKLTGYKQSIVAVANGAIPIDPVVIPSPSPDPDATEAPITTPAPTPNSGEMISIPVGVTSYAMDWFGGQNMSEGNLSVDNYVGCYKGSGNSYKSNAFNLDSLSITRGYQVKQLDARSFYCRPAEDCLVTVYFYSSNGNSVGLYTDASQTQPKGMYTPASSGTYAYTYHFTDVGSPLYFSGVEGDLYIAGIATSKAESAFDYSVKNSSFDDNGKLSVELTYTGSELEPTAKLIVAEYSDNESVLENVAIFDIQGEVVNDLDYLKGNYTVVKLLILDNMNNIRPLMESVLLK